MRFSSIKKRFQMPLTKVSNAFLFHVFLVVPAMCTTAEEIIVRINT
jgi:hypothetical protein